MRMSIERRTIGYVRAWAHTVGEADGVRAHTDGMKGVVLTAESADGKMACSIALANVRTAERMATALAAAIEAAKEKARPTCVRCNDVMPDATRSHLCSKCLAREGKFCIRCGHIMAADTKKAVCPKCLADDG